MTRKMAVEMSHTRRFHHQPIAAETAAKAPNRAASRITGPMSLVGKLPSVKNLTLTYSDPNSSFHAGLKKTKRPGR